MDPGSRRGRCLAFHERPDALELADPTMDRRHCAGEKRWPRSRRPCPAENSRGSVWYRVLAVHTGYEKDHFFDDIQQRGPFRVWRHRHEFTSENGGTRLTDRIEFSLPLAPLSDWLLAWLVSMQLRRMFTYRYQATAREV